MSRDQLLSFRQEQMHAMSMGILEAILDALDPLLPPHGNWSDYYPDFDLPHFTRRPHGPSHPVPSTESPPQSTTSRLPDVSESTVAVSTDGHLFSRTVNSEDTISVSELVTTGRVTLYTGGVKATSRPRDQNPLPPGRDRPWPPGSDVEDPVQGDSAILDMVEAIPDSITTQNVDQFVSVLAFIPAADIASKFTPAAVGSRAAIIPS